MKAFRHSRTRLLSAFALVSWLWVAAPALGDRLVSPEQMPGTLKEVGIEQQLGEMLPLDLQFVDERGRDVRLGDFFNERPVILVFVYYECPMLCPMVINGVAKSLGVLKFDVGDQFDVIAISVDPEETPAMAANMKHAAINRYGRNHTDQGWHFLTGSEASIRQLTETVGFGYAYVEETDEWAHASGMIVATPQGQLSKYFYGIDFPPRHVRLALVEASSNQIGTMVDQLLLYCFRYDPALGKYTAIITRVLRLTAILFCICMAIFFVVMRRRDRAMAQLHTSTVGASSR